MFVNSVERAESLSGRTFIEFNRTSQGESLRPTAVNSGSVRPHVNNRPTEFQNTLKELKLPKRRSGEIYPRSCFLRERKVT